MTAEIFDQRVCALGEGPLWHPSRGQLFWFDILGKKLMTQSASVPVEWSFDEHVSAAGWIDDATLLIASETGLMHFSILTGQHFRVAALEENNEITRSNDGRADPWGGFWIGTMGKTAEPLAGGIYRLYKGEMRKLVNNVTVSNSICFAPDQNVAYYADTPTYKIMQVPLSSEDGWPSGEAKVFIDLSSEKLRPDGSVVDKEGCLWNAQWGAGRVARYGSNGSLLSTHDVLASQTTCPAFGGENLRTVFVTSAADGLKGSQDGKTFRFDAGVTGQAEHRVIL
jgi:sugar lactone lactonase YvrE